MTATPSIDPARLLHEQLAQASPDLLRELLQTFINALVSADADAVCGADYGTRSAERTNRRKPTAPRSESASTSIATGRIWCLTLSMLRSQVTTSINTSCSERAMSARPIAPILCDRRWYRRELSSGAGVQMPPPTRWDCLGRHPAVEPLRLRAAPTRPARSRRTPRPGSAPDHEASDRRSRARSAAPKRGHAPARWRSRTSWRRPS